MKRLMKVIAIILAVCLVIGSSSYLLYKNIKLNKSYEAASQQLTELQAKLDAVGTFADVYTVKAKVGMGQEIKAEDLVLQTVPTSSIPTNVINDQNLLIGNYFRIALHPGNTLTTDLVVAESYIGSVYERDVFLDQLPVGIQVGDYIDVRVVLPGGEEYVVFPHKRVNARYENAVKMKFDEADLWIYTSMMIDRAMYRDAGFKIYSTRYVDPGAHDLTVAYYPIRKEAVDIMNISGNLTSTQKSRMWNPNLRTSIDAKMKNYISNDNSVSSSVSEEESRASSAEAYYQSIIDAIVNNPSDTDAPPTLVDPNAPIQDSGVSLEQAVGTPSTDVPSVDGQTDAAGNGNVIASQDYLNNLGDDLFKDETPIE